MTSAQVVETSVNVISNSPSQDYTHPDDRTLLYKNKLHANFFVEKQLIEHSDYDEIYNHISHFTSQ